MSVNDELTVPLPRKSTWATAKVVQDATWDLSAAKDDPFVVEFNDYFTKYSFAEALDEHNVHGLFGQTQESNGTRAGTLYNRKDQTRGETWGAWLVRNSKDTYYGGPRRTDLTVDGIVYNYQVSQHSGGNVPNITAGFDRTFGPAYFYFNHGAWNSTVYDLRHDAEQYSSPTWNLPFYEAIAPSVPGYVAPSKRITFKARILLPQSAEKAVVTLSANGRDFQDNADRPNDYQYWAPVAKATGEVSIPMVVPGKYRMTIQARGVFGEFIQDDVNIDDETTVSWEEESAGRELWRIGIPDRSAGEFRHGFARDRLHSLHPQEYRIFWRAYDYIKDFPNGVHFKIGESTEAEDWNYAHWDQFNSINTSDWKISWHQNGEQAGSEATLTVQLAAAKLGNANATITQEALPCTMVIRLGVRAQEAHVTAITRLSISILSVCLLPQAIIIATALIILKWIRTAILCPVPKALGRRRKRILVTGGDLPSILAMSRALEAAGHDVYVIDYERAPFSSPLRISNAITKFVALPAAKLSPSATAIRASFSRLRSIVNISLDTSQKQPLVNLLAAILQLIEHQKMDLWIPIKDNGLKTILQTKEIVTKHSTCQVYGPDVEAIRLAQDQAHFSRYVDHLEHDIRCPVAAVVRTRAEIHRILSKDSTGQNYVLERRILPLKLQQLPSEPRMIEPDLDSRIHQTPTDLVDQRYTLPLSSQNETYSSVAALKISREQPWLMQQVIEGTPVTVSALVIKNIVSTFTASISQKDIVMPSIQPYKIDGSVTDEWRNRTSWQQSDHARNLDPKSVTVQMLLDFTQRFSHQLPPSTDAQLNLRFILSESASSGAIVQRIWAIGCDFEISSLLIERSHVFGQLGLVGAAYGCAANGGPTLLSASATPFNDRDLFAIYSLPAAVYYNVFLPVVKVLLRQAPFTTVLTGLASFLYQMAFGREELLSSKDPLPWLWKWFVQLPVENAADLCEVIIGILAACLDQREAIWR
ncbi:hypothetical protein FKW77_000300 [Venturia effusa]|uniref:Uncharacterized protein n=1 Tax=Venturia effusa TaxID=50376 RepID=A0A517KVN1_9PEZI|nr:hypothetical protein FKW77_000300 [Venturia effusa]